MMPPIVGGCCKILLDSYEEGTDNFYENQGGFEHSKMLLDLSVVPGAGLEPAWMISPRDFKSLAPTNFATRALNSKKKSISSAT